MADKLRESDGILNVEYDVISQFGIDDNDVVCKWILLFKLPHIREYVNINVGYTFNDANPIEHLKLLNELKYAILTQYYKIRDVNFIETPIYMEEIKL
jgi:hypothetical protein